MRIFLGIAVVGAAIFSASAGAENTLMLVCKCQSVVVNGDEQRGCARQSDRSAVIDLDKRTLQWSNGTDMIWPAIPATITPDAIDAGLEPGKMRSITGRLEIGHYSINRITGEFVEDGMGHTTDAAAPNVDFIVPGQVRGGCTKIDAPKF